MIGGEDERGLARQAVPPAALQPERPGGDPGGEAEQEAARDARSAAWCGKPAARALGEERQRIEEGLGGVGGLLPWRAGPGGGRQRVTGR